MDDEIETTSEAVEPLSPLANVFAYVSLFVALGLSATTLLEVIGRYTRLIPTQWLGGEMSILFLIWMIAMGIVFATLTNSHLRLDINVIRIAPKHMWIVGVIRESLSLVLLVVFSYYVLTYTIDSADAATPSLGISYAWMNGALFIGTSLSAVVMAVRVLRMVRNRTDLTSPEYGDVDG